MLKSWTAQLEQGAESHERLFLKRYDKIAGWAAAIRQRARAPHGRPRAFSYLT